MARLSAVRSRFSIPVRGISLRAKALAAVVLLLSTPLLLVYVSVIGDTSVQREMEQGLDVAVLSITEASTAIDRRTVAQDRAIWLRVIAEDGQLVEDENHQSPVGGWVTQIFFGAAGAPTHAEYDQTLRPIDQRDGLREMSRGVVTCHRNASGMLLICTAVVDVSNPTSGRQMVVLQKSSRRAIRALYDVRVLLLKLTLATLMVSLPVVYLLVTRLLTPIEELRSAMSKRAASPQTATPVRREHDDEIGDMALAFNELLLQLDIRRQSYASFVADLAHELKNPVAAVRAVSESMEANSSVSEERLRRWSRVLADSGKKLDVLVTEFLALARAESGQLMAPSERFDLSALVVGIVSSVSGGGLYDSVVFRTNVNSVFVMGVSSRLEEAIRNIVVNAASFVDPQSGTVSVSVTDEGEWCAVHVDDDGPGVSEDIGDKVFKRFFTTRPNRGGTGLGLALTRAVVESHGGRVDVGMSPLGGARFSIMVPVSQD